MHIISQNTHDIYNYIIIELPEICATYHTVSVYPVLARAHADVYCIIYNYIYNYIYYIVCY